MAGNIRVTPAELEAMGDRYAMESGQVEDQIGRLDQMIGNLNDMWDGQSSEAFSDQYQELRPSIDQMKILLLDVSNQLKKTSAALQDADAQIAGQIRGS
ncbi:WXG100 family type VII secretion target [Aquibacillus rhizosphaerae]|uniref:ESAT-6-like protein n=1 Tax=Aquibacillus rhizosphaerae TaxID=3051431 RepID=A0ABT7L5S1_9BACI|nr:WXG100 family type VII secretion target [Aquibacillus sp. LR5S19]MDL4840547.1 WXG100 family type VII secretion target [Aquibacillus sp. LR5S19]